MSGIVGVRWSSVERRGDGRGSFREIWRQTQLDPADVQHGANGPFVQVNVSTSAPGVLRGLHYHRRQLDHWIVLSGKAFVALVDVRPLMTDADASPIVETRTLQADDTVTIPIGVAHGFLAQEPLELLYLVTNEYDGSDELGFAWDDPTAGIEWPSAGADGRPTLSARDGGNPALRDLVRQLRIAV